MQKRWRDAITFEVATGVGNEPVVELLAWALVMNAASEPNILGVPSGTVEMHVSGPVVELEVAEGLARSVNGCEYSLNGPQLWAGAIEAMYIHAKYILVPFDRSDPAQDREARKEAIKLSAGEYDAVVQSWAEGRLIDQAIGDLIRKMQGSGTDAAIEELFGLKGREQ